MNVVNAEKEKQTFLRSKNVYGELDAMPKAWLRDAEHERVRLRIRSEESKVYTQWEPLCGPHLRGHPGQDVLLASIWAFNFGQYRSNNMVFRLRLLLPNLKRQHKGSPQLVARKETFDAFVEKRPPAP